MAIGSRNIRIGDVLKEYGYVTDDQIAQAIDYQRENRGVRLGAALTALGFITEKQVMKALSEKMNMPIVDLDSAEIDLEAVQYIPAQIAEKYNMLAIKATDMVLTVALNDPMNFFGIEDIRQLTGMQLELMLADSKSLERAIRYNYNEVSALKAAKAANSSVDEELEEMEVEDGDDDTPVINLLNSLVKRASSINASDIHIEPFEKKTVVRMRIDGTIVDYVTLQKSIHNSLIARIKIISDLDIAEKRIPQDGHFKMMLEDGPLNMRVSMLPTVFGEKCVMRLLANNSPVANVASYGMQPDNCAKFQSMLKTPNGIIYITGPTGSGKTTTLYMALNTLAQEPVNISTIEDPVEKTLPRINQSQVNNQAGMTFEIGLRALLRQDPDIIMIGETRDTETANIAVKSAITGHKVFSTLHTNDAASSVIRLVDMGVEPYMLASALTGIVAQRLMRRVCKDCATLREATEEEQAFMETGPIMVKKANGCANCNNAGYKGRIAIHEVLVIDKEIKRMLNNNCTTEDIRDYAVEQQHMSTLKMSGIELVKQGVTTVDELVKVAYSV
jgi:type IV pilus assembly protein PilB